MYKGFCAVCKKMYFANHLFGSQNYLTKEAVWVFCKFKESHSFHLHSSVESTFIRSAIY